MSIFFQSKNKQIKIHIFMKVLEFIFKESSIINFCSSIICSRTSTTIVTPSSLAIITTSLTLLNNHLSKSLMSRTAWPTVHSLTTRDGLPTSASMRLDMCKRRERILLAVTMVMVCLMMVVCFKLGREWEENTSPRARNQYEEWRNLFARVAREVVMVEDGMMVCDWVEVNVMVWHDLVWFAESSRFSGSTV